MKRTTNPANTIPGNAVDDLLVSFAPEVRELALAARSFILKTIPNLTEQVDITAKIIGYGYGSKYIGMVCMIMPTKAGVNLGIAYAMQLPGSKELLEGSGKLHRHVKLKSQTDLQNASLKVLLQAASDAAIARRETPAKTPKE